MAVTTGLNDEKIVAESTDATLKKKSKKSKDGSKSKSSSDKSSKKKRKTAEATETVSTDEQPKKKKKKSKVEPVHSSSDSEDTTVSAAAPAPAIPVAAASAVKPAPVAPVNPLSLDNFRLSSPVKSLLRAKDMETLFDIQAQTLNFCLDGFDLVGRARTGCGKTLAFVLPIIEKLASGPDGGKKPFGRSPRVIVLAPTRELAKQVCYIPFVMSLPITSMSFA